MVWRRRDRRRGGQEFDGLEGGASCLRFRLEEQEEVILSNQTLEIPGQTRERWTSRPDGMDVETEHATRGR